MPVVVIKRGPIFDGSFDRKVRAGMEEGTRVAADDAAQRVRDRGRRKFRYESSTRTGRWNAAVRARVIANVHIISDSRIVYGRWIEGVSRRNFTSRFKGYKVFRQTLAEVRVRAPEIVRASIMERLR